MRKALVVVDYTVDFVAENGALTCGKTGQKIESAIVRLTNEFKINNDLVVFPVDLHEQNIEFHPETKLFPPHNICNSPGRELYGWIKHATALLLVQIYYSF